uniref:Uncharacterized protein n=1 Tax=Globisporangium ultimum (strain ATCC 200006 / CBS 805.95 / DAOM BR144) TaxID=431595 RepID=K3W8G8_GLOUD
MEQMVSDMGDWKNQVLTLQGQIQVRAVLLHHQVLFSCILFPESQNTKIYEPTPFSEQLEVLTKQSVSHERDAIQSQLTRERDEWKQNEAHRAALETRKVEQFRSMDFELRQLRQSLSRLRVEWESEKSSREKAESALLKATETSDVQRKTLAVSRV